MGGEAGESRAAAVAEGAGEGSVAGGGSSRDGGGGGDGGSGGECGCEEGGWRGASQMVQQVAEEAFSNVQAGQRHWDGTCARVCGRIKRCTGTLLSHSLALLKFSVLRSCAASLCLTQSHAIPPPIRTSRPMRRPCCSLTGASASDRVSTACVPAVGAAGWGVGGGASVARAGGLGAPPETRTEPRSGDQRQGINGRR